MASLNVATRKKRTGFSLQPGAHALNTCVFFFVIIIIIWHENSQDGHIRLQKGANKIFECYRVLSGCYNG